MLNSIRGYHVEHAIIEICGSDSVGEGFVLGRARPNEIGALIAARGKVVQSLADGLNDPVYKSSAASRSYLTNIRYWELRRLRYDTLLNPTLWPRNSSRWMRFGAQNERPLQRLPRRCLLVGLSSKSVGEMEP